MQDNKNITDAQFELLEVLNDLDVEDRVFLRSDYNLESEGQAVLEIQTNFRLENHELKAMFDNDWIESNEIFNVQTTNDGGCVWIAESNKRRKLQEQTKRDREQVFHAIFKVDESLPLAIFFREYDATTWARMMCSDRQFKLEKVVLDNQRLYHSLSNHMLRKALNEIHSWLVCAAFANTDDLAQSFPEMTKIAEDAINNFDEQSYFATVCPCVVADESCHSRCACVVPTSSAGCLCCASYGDERQRRNAANSIIKRLAPTKTIQDEALKSSEPKGIPGYAAYAQEAEIKRTANENENLRMAVKRLQQEVIALNVELEKSALKSIQVWSDEIARIVERRVQIEEQYKLLKEAYDEVVEENKELENKLRSSIAEKDTYVQTIVDLQDSTNILTGKVETLEDSDRTFRKDIRQLINELPEEGITEPIYLRIRALKLELDKYKALSGLLTHKLDGEYWMWQGDSSDQPESLTCPVIMSASTLRELLETINQSSQFQEINEKYAVLSSAMKDGYFIWRGNKEDIPNPLTVSVMMSPIKFQELLSGKEPNNVKGFTHGEEIEEIKRTIAAKVTWLTPRELEEMTQYIFKIMNPETKENE